LQVPLVCARCKTAPYCSEACQVAHSKMKKGRPWNRDSLRLSETHTQTRKSQRVYVTYTCAHPHERAHARTLTVAFPPQLAPFLSVAARSRRSQGDFSKAIAYHAQHLAIAKEVGHRAGEGRAYGNLGIAYNTQGDCSDALEHHAQHLVIAKEVGDRAYANLRNAYH
jgi:tetratricopeptide (TPR) repeat protein